MLTILACENDRFVPAARDDLPQMLRAPGGLVWIDLEAPTEEEWSILRDPFRFHQLTIDDCLNSRVDPPKVDDYRSYLFIVVQGIGMEASDTVQTTELNLYVGRNYVVSFHHQPLHAVDETRARCSRGAASPTRGPDWLTHAILDTLVDQILPVVEQMDDEISDLEDQALDRPERAIVTRMTALKRSILQIRRLSAPQRDVVNRLSRGDHEHLIRAETRMYYRDIYDHLVRLEDTIEALRDLGDSVIATYLATVNNRMNEIMKTLSLVSTTFLPLTLLASVFGTNFAPTYEAWGWSGFIGMCLFMVISIAGLTWWFRKYHWL